MADKKISQLTAATTPLAGTEVLPIVQSGSTVKVSAADITAGRNISASGLTLSGGSANSVVYLNGTKVASTGANLAFDGANLTLGTATGSVVNVGSSAVTTGTCGVSVGSARTGTGVSYVDLKGDTTYAYGLRLLRDNNDNANSFSYIFHRGTGNFEIRAEDAAPIIFKTNNVDRGRWTSGGQFALASDGTTTAPAISRDSDLNTGVWFPAADTVGITAGGTSGVYVTNGKVGVITSSPQQPLHVQGNFAVNGSTVNAYGETTITASFNTLPDGDSLEVDLDLISDAAFLIEFSAKGLNSATGDTAAVRALIKGSKIANLLYDSAVSSVYASRWSVPTVANVAGTNRIKITMANANGQSFDSFNTVMLKVLGSDRAVINAIAIV